MEYKDAGVNLDNYNFLIGKIKELVKTTYDSNVILGVGGFAGIYQIDERRVMVASADGVGTKILLAKEYDKYDGLGYDLVAMNVDDVICTGIPPIILLDYFAMGRIDNRIYLEVMESIVKAVKEAEVVLLGGETAEMPDMYPEGIFDLSATAIGVGEKQKILPKIEKIEKEDVIIGLPSSGFHSNGFSLIRKIVKEKKLDLWKDYGFGKPLGEMLLTPTRIYTPILKKLLSTPLAEKIKAIAHITGGGIVENIPRVIPEHLKMKIYWEKIKIPEEMEFIIKTGEVPIEEARRVFNMGIGMALITSKNDAEKILDYLKEGEVIGSLQ